jgi:hypothetical protein
MHKKYDKKNKHKQNRPIIRRKKRTLLTKNWDPQPQVFYLNNNFVETFVIMTVRTRKS